MCKRDSGRLSLLRVLRRGGAAAVVSAATHAAAGGRKVRWRLRGPGGVFDVDVTFVRVAWIVLSIWPGAIILGIAAYLVAWVLIPVADVIEAPARAQKQLLRSRTDRRIGGVCGGLAEYFGADPTIVRVAWVVLTIVPCAIVFGVIAYLVAWLVIPSAPEPRFQTVPSTP